MNEILSAFGVDWPSLLAQVVNFAILVFILSKFVYRPMLKIIDERRSIIASSLKKAEEIDRRRELLDADRVKILRKADEEAGALLARAKTEAEAMRTEIEAAAKAQASSIVAKGLQQLQIERTHMMKEIQEKLARTIVQSAEKILRREFSKEDQENFEDELKKNLPSMLS
jgi:F-type H+-transporting ATPase subunit b